MDLKKDIYISGTINYNSSSIYGVEGDIKTYILHLRLDIL